jgi:hypothetical protein
MSGQKGATKLGPNASAAEIKKGNAGLLPHKPPFKAVPTAASARIVAGPARIVAPATPAAPGAPAAMKLEHTGARMEVDMDADAKQKEKDVEEEAGVRARVLRATPAECVLEVTGPRASLAMGNAVVRAALTQVPVLRAAMVEIKSNGTAMDADTLRQRFQLLSFTDGAEGRARAALVEPELCACLRMGCGRCSLLVEWRVDNADPVFPAALRARDLRAAPSAAHPLDARALGVRPVHGDAVLARVSPLRSLVVRALLRLQRGEGSAAAVAAPRTRVVPRVEIEVQTPDVARGQEPRRWREAIARCPAKVFGPDPGPAPGPDPGPAPGPDPGGARPTADAKVDSKVDAKAGQNRTLDVEDLAMLASMRKYAGERSAACVLCRACEDYGVARIREASGGGFRLHVDAGPSPSPNQIAGSDAPVPAPQVARAALLALRAMLREPIHAPVEPPFRPSAEGAAGSGARPAPAPLAR